MEAKVILQPQGLVHSAREIRGQADRHPTAPFIK